MDELFLAGRSLPFLTLYIGGIVAFLLFVTIVAVRSSRRK